MKAVYKNDRAGQYYCLGHVMAMNAHADSNVGKMVAVLSNRTGRYAGFRGSVHMDGSHRTQKQK